MIKSATMAVAAVAANERKELLKVRSVENRHNHREELTRVHIIRIIQTYSTT
jgi:hypothetical protein